MMSPVELLLYAVCPIVAITYVVVYSHLFAPARRYLGANDGQVGYMVNCPVCTGFWAGAVVGLFNIPREWPPWVQLPVLCGCAGVTITFLIEIAITASFEKKGE